MSRRFAAVASALSLCVLLAAVVAAQQPRIANGRVAGRSASSGLAEAFRTLVAAQSEITWIGYAVPLKDGDRTMCCWSSANGTTYFSGTIASGEASCCGSCRIEPASESAGIRPQAPAAAGSAGPIKLEGPDRMVVLFRIVDSAVERIRTFSDDCELDAGGRQVHWLDGVRPADSVALLASLIDAERERKSRVTNAALQAISLHAEPAAATVIERLARGHAAAAVRSEALFWLAQMAGEKAAGTITEAIAKDPDTEVKRRAVFALSQLPRQEGVPLLIDVARRNTNPAVRKQAIFWLGQTKDPRAIEFFAEILR